MFLTDLTERNTAERRFNWSDVIIGMNISDWSRITFSCIAVGHAVH